MREHTPQWGISCTPGGQERPKVAPLTYYGEGRPMKQRVFPTMVKYIGIFIEHNSASQCHRDMGVGLFYSGNQSDSQDYCDAVKPRPGNHLEHPSN